MNVASLARFFKEHLLGLCIFAILTGVATNFLYDSFKPHYSVAPSQPVQIHSSGGETTAPTLDEVRHAIGAMVEDFPRASPLRVNIVTSPVKGVVAVTLTPPYREFPNVILFRYDNGADKWKPIVESLCIGIQPEVSSRLDLHTVGEAVDIEPITKPGESRDEQTRTISAIGAGRGLVTVVYDKFIHCHACAQETYIIDKRGYSRLRERLFPDLKVSDDVCTWFDMPEVSDVSLSHNSGRFRLTASTLNGQLWTVTFTGIDGGGYLQQKFVNAANGPK